MPRSWTNKEERKYEHIKDSAVERGSSEERAKELAARTVNKHRRQAGKTQNRRSQGTGNPNKPLEERTKVELYNSARQLHIQGRSAMTKSQLVEAVRRAS